MVVKKAEKLSKEFSDHERLHLTKYDHIKNNEKRKVRLLLGELPSARLPFFTYIRGLEATKVVSRGSKQAGTEHLVA